MRKMFLICLSFLSVINSFAQNKGKIIEEEMVYSNILGKNVEFSVYLPSDYEFSRRNYPVVYLLHGLSDDNTSWVQFGEINRLMDKAIEKGIIPPMIIIMPNAFSSYYINAYDGKENYESFFIKEFIPAIEKKYRIKTQKAFRGIAGLSMGGYGSIIYGLKYPELFTACAPLSAAVWSDAQLVHMKDNEYEYEWGEILGKELKGTKRLSKTWNENSPLGIIKQKNQKDLKKIRYWIDCGDDDFLTTGNSLLHIALTEKGVPHEFRMRDGSHNWNYWRSGIIDALAFIGESFRR